MSIRVLTHDRLMPDKGIPYCGDHIRRLVLAGQFPKPIKIGRGRNAWIETEINLWLQARANLRDEA